MPAVRRASVDFARASYAWTKGETAFTPPVSLIRGLHVALRMIHEEGLAHVLARHARLANALRAGVNTLGLATFTSAERLSNTLSVFRVPEGLDGKKIVRRLADSTARSLRARATSSAPVIRIGTMGWVGDGDVLTDLHHLRGCPNRTWQPD